MKVEDYLMIIKTFYDKKVFNKDLNRFMEWEEIIEDFLTYEDFKNVSIREYIENNILSSNSNCVLM